jgi:phosphoadenosine phosphosulfate reductase
MNNDYIEFLNKELSGKTINGVFKSLIKLNLGEIAFSTSFGLEDQVITDVIFSNNHPINVFTLDTGRLFEETYEVYHETLNKYNRTITPYFPNQEKVEALLAKKGPYSFYKSLENIIERVEEHQIGNPANIIFGHAVTDQVVHFKHLKSVECVN